LAITLVTAWTLRFLAANDPAFPKSHNLLNVEFELPVLPRVLGLLTMLAATTVNAWRDRVERPSTWIRRCTVGVGVLAAFLLIVAIEANQMLIPALVYIAISGIESAEPLRLATEGLELNWLTRTMRFAIAGFAGCALLLLNLIFVELLIRGRRLRGRYGIALALLVVGVVAQCGIALWISCRGIWQLSPAFSETLAMPPRVVVATVGGLILVAAGSWSWQRSVKSASIERPSMCGALGLHETWPTCTMLALFAIAMYFNANPLVFEYLRGNVSRIEFVGNFIASPTNFLCVGVAIASVHCAGKRFFRSKKPLRSTTPQIDVSQYISLTIATSLMLLTSGPIALAAGFGIWFLERWRS
jgi:hypothetical protein